MATLTIMITPITVSVSRSRSLPTTKLGLQRARRLEDLDQGVAHARDPPEAGVDEHGEADHADGAGAAFCTASSEIWSGPFPISPGSTLSSAVTRLSCASGNNDET